MCITYSIFILLYLSLLLFLPDPLFSSLSPSLLLYPLSLLLSPSYLLLSPDPFFLLLLLLLPLYISLVAPSSLVSSLICAAPIRQFPNLLQQTRTKIDKVYYVNTPRNAFQKKALPTNPKQLTILCPCQWTLPLINPAPIRAFYTLLLSFQYLPTFSQNTSFALCSSRLLYFLSLSFPVSLVLFLLLPLFSFFSLISHLPDFSIPFLFSYLLLIYFFLPFLFFYFSYLLLLPLYIYLVISFLLSFLAN